MTLQDADLGYFVLIRLVEHRYLEYVFLSVKEKLFRAVETHGLVEVVEEIVVVVIMPTIPVGVSI